MVATEEADRNRVGSCFSAGGFQDEGGSSGGSTNTTYSSSEDAIIQSYERTLRCLYNDPEMTFDWSQNLNMQSIGGPIQMGDCNLSDPLPFQEAVCACEQSIYHANLDGHECYNYNIQYWYHPDYLGSVEFVTDRDGEAYQFFLNTPWGENLENHSGYSYKSFSSRFRFNGKELDEETGNYYYGARYYDPKTSIWLSVDPLMGNNPHLSPYNFVSNNPIMRIDPDGMDDHEWLLNTESGEMEKVSDMGGDEEQIVHYVEPNESGDLVHKGTHVFEGSEVYSGPVSTDYDGGYTYGASTKNVWAGVPAEYLGHYNSTDLATRYTASNRGNKLMINYIEGQEAMGLDRRDMIWNAKDYRRFMLNKYGTDASFVMAHEEGMLPLPVSIGGAASYGARSLSVGRSIYFKSVPGLSGSTYFKNVPIRSVGPMRPNPKLMDDFLRNGFGGMGGM